MYEIRKDMKRRKDVTLQTLHAATVKPSIIGIIHPTSLTHPPAPGESSEAAKAELAQGIPEAVSSQKILERLTSGADAGGSAAGQGGAATPSLGSATRSTEE